MSCDKKDCVNRGAIYGLTQETNCSYCIHWIDTWRKDLYVKKSTDKYPDQSCEECRHQSGRIEGIGNCKKCFSHSLWEAYGKGT